MCVCNACVHACEHVYMYILCVLERVYWGVVGGGTVRHTAGVLVMSLTSVVQFDYAFSIVFLLFQVLKDIELYDVNLAATIQLLTDLLVKNNKNSEEKV